MAWNLWVAQRMLEGARLNVDIVELNPPLVLYIAVAVHAMGETLGVWDLTMYRILGLLLAALAVVLVTRIGPRALRDWPAHARHVLLLLWIFLILAAPGTLFAQREHLMMILIAPHVLAAIALMRGDDVGTSIAVAAGVMAGLGFALKPHYLPVWLALELFVVRARGLRSVVRPGHVALLCVFAGYGVTVLLAGRDYLDIARRTAQVYGAYFPSTPLQILGSPGAILSAAALLAALLVPATDATRALRRFLIVAIPLLVVAVFVQNKNWSYHWYPAWLCAVVLLAIVVFDGLARFRSAAAPRHLVAFTAVLLLGATAVSGAQSRSDWAFMAGEQYRLPEMIQLVEQRGGEGPIVAFSTGMQVAFPLVNYTGIGWGLRFPTLWMIPGFYANGRGMLSYHAPAEMSDNERWFFHAVVEDFVRSRPTLLFVDTRPAGNLLHGFDYLVYFSQDSRFVQAMRDYSYAGDVGPWRIFQRVR
jgi:hypothetical protein